MIDTSADFAAARVRLGLDKAGLARVLRLGKDGRNTIRRIEQGQPPPGPYRLAMEALADGWRPKGIRLPIDKDTNDEK